jgi:hypothetical protein
MRELVPLTNAFAALMIVSAMSGLGGEDAILAGAPGSVPNAAEAAAVAAAAQAEAATEAAAASVPELPVAKSPVEAKAAPPANDRSREHHSARWLLAAV